MRGGDVAASVVHRRELAALTALAPLAVDPDVQSNRIVDRATAQALRVQPSSASATSPVLPITRKLASPPRKGNSKVRRKRA